MFKDFSFVKKSNFFFDVNYNPYLTDYNEDSLPSSWLLYQSFISEQKSPFFEKKTQQLQEKMGVNRTVWGYKIDDLGIASWEYYYYYYKVFGLHNFENVLQTSKSLELISENFISYKNSYSSEYYILSFEFKEEKADSFSIYYPHLLQPFSEEYKQFFQQGKHYFDSRTRGFISYEMKGNSLEETNYYKGLSTLHHRETLFTEIRLLCETKLPEISESNYLSDIYLLPFLTEKSSCRPWCIARKKNSVKLYLTDVNISNFIIFIKHFNYPLSFISKIEDEATSLSHLKYDFAIEISYKKGDKNLTINNPVIYGTF